MKSIKSEPVEGCAAHEWRDLFEKPNLPEHVREHMAYGYADFMTCSKCGAVCMVDGPTARAVHLLSESSADSKRRHANVWNAKTAGTQQRGPQERETAGSPS